MAKSDGGPAKMAIRFDDDFTTNTTDVARIWFSAGDQPRDTASIAVMVRSVGHNNAFQEGMHVRACCVIREALEKAFAPDTTISILMTSNSSEGEKPAATEVTRD